MAFQSPRFERACVPKISPQRLVPHEVAVALNVLRLQLLREIARSSGQANPIEIVPTKPYCPFGQSMTGWSQVDQIIHLTGMAGRVAFGLDLPSSSALRKHNIRSPPDGSSQLLSHDLGVIAAPLPWCLANVQSRRGRGGFVALTKNIEAIPCPDPCPPCVLSAEPACGFLPSGAAPDVRFLTSGTA
jgi:hypothetical protein